MAAFFKIETTSSSPLALTERSCLSVSMCRAMESLIEGSPLAKGERLVTIVAMNRFTFIKPMSHAQLSPLQLKRTQLTRLP